MKKRKFVYLIAAFAIAGAACVPGGCFGDGTGNTDDANRATHSEHRYVKQVAESKYLKSEADCTHKAVYYLSCECGEKGTETFEYGEPKAHIFDKQTVEEKYLVSEADCTHKAVYHLSCECGEEGTETFEHGETSEHKYKEGICETCEQPDPSYKRKTVTKEEWQKAFDLTNYDNCEVVCALFDKDDPTFDQGNNIRRFDGNKAYLAYIKLEISAEPPFEILSKPPYEVGCNGDDNPDDPLEYYFEDKNSEDAEEWLNIFEAELVDLYDKFTYDKNVEEYVYECEEEKARVSFENGKPTEIYIDYFQRDFDQVMIVEYKYGGVEIILPEQD